VAIPMVYLLMSIELNDEILRPHKESYSELFQMWGLEINLAPLPHDLAFVESQAICWPRPVDNREELIDSPRRILDNRYQRISFVIGLIFEGQPPPENTSE